MDNTNTNPDRIPELDSETANQLLNNIFAECEVVPNAIPLETLESWGNYKKTEFRLGRVISYVVLVILVLLPLLFFRPTIIAQRTNVDATDNAVYEIQVRTLLPVDGVSATIDGTPVSLEKVNSKNYMVAIPQNGTLLIKATAMNGQYSVKKYEVTHLDMDKPELIRSYTENGYINIVRLATGGKALAARRTGIKQGMSFHMTSLCPIPALLTLFPAEARFTPPCCSRSAPAIPSARTCWSSADLPA